jgi:hypothetical protein
MKNVKKCRLANRVYGVGDRESLPVSEAVWWLAVSAT